MRGSDPLGRMHALWSLHGMGGVTEAIALRGLTDPDRRVRHAAIRVSEVHASRGEVLLSQWRELARSDPWLRHQVLLSLGELRGERSERLMASLLAEDASTPALRSAALSGLRGRELAFTRRLLESETWREQAPGRDALLRLLARAVIRAGRGDAVWELVELTFAGERVAWQSLALLDGIEAGRPKDPLGQPGYVQLQDEPAALEVIARLPEGELRTRATEIEAFLAWPGKQGVEGVEVEPLTEEQRARFDQGREIFGAICAQCHMPSGLGDPGKAPPLRGSPWVLGAKERPIRVLLHGMEGTIERAGGTWDMEMPAFAATDEDIAAVLTYIRREWGTRRRAGRARGGRPRRRGHRRAHAPVDRGRASRRPRAGVTPGRQLWTTNSMASVNPEPKLAAGSRNQYCALTVAPRTRDGSAPDWIRALKSKA